MQPDRLLAHFDDFLLQQKDEVFVEHAQGLKDILRQLLKGKKHGDFARWYDAYQSFLDRECDVDFYSDAVRIGSELSEGERVEIKAKLMALHPWRKGPFSFFGVQIQTEWQCWMKWNRLAPHLPSLKDKRVLDIGCGNGYYLFRMAHEKPKLLLGVEPSLLFNMQFLTLEKYLKSGAYILPMGIEDFPEDIAIFDHVFSMGVLYHRKDPIGHLAKLKSFLAPKGSIILETLVVEGDVNTCLIPEKRYAKMRNVWFLPSVEMMMRMMRRAGFKEVSCVDVSLTSFSEQKSSPWTFPQSLSDYLTEDGKTTVEGYPPPRRAFFKGSI